MRIDSRTADMARASSPLSDQNADEGKLQSSAKRNLIGASARIGMTEKGSVKAGKLKCGCYLQDSRRRRRRRRNSVSLGLGRLINCTMSRSDLTELKYDLQRKRIRIQRSVMMV